MNKDRFSNFGQRDAAESTVGNVKFGLSCGYWVINRHFTRKMWQGEHKCSWQSSPGEAVPDDVPVMNNIRNNTQGKL